MFWRRFEIPRSAPGILAAQSSGWRFPGYGPHAPSQITDYGHMVCQKFVSSSPASLFLCCVFVAVTMIWFGVAPVAAQDMMPKDSQESNAGIRVGSYLSLFGVGASASGPWFGSEPIEQSEDDVMPYPIWFYSIKYNNYEAIIGWGDDAYGRYDSNEKILKFALRYTAYRTNHMYMFAGPIVWHFNKRYSHTKYVCDEYEYLPHTSFCKEGAGRQEEIKTDRPDGSSIHFGALFGLGVEYKLLGAIVFSHEFELFFAPCRYKEFVCRGADLKFLGVHLEF